MLDIFNKVLHTGLDLLMTLMPIRRVRGNTSDAPWMNDHLKSLILKRQKAFHDGGTESMLYKFHRNAVNRERKSCKASFYKSNVEHMKEENPKVWWKEVKRLCGFNSNPGNVSSHIHIEGIENLSDQDLTNAINEAFLEPVSIKCRLQTADCRLQTGYKMQTRMQTADCRLGIKCRLISKPPLRQIQDTFSIFNLP